jgi:HPt (histidine-containing phosphotransfer) domain-containing protein
MNNPDINDKLAALKERFNQRLHDTQHTISQWQESTHIAELIEITHKLAGTAGTYGLPDLSKEMKQLELQLLEIKNREINNEQAQKFYHQAIDILRRNTMCPRP